MKNKELFDRTVTILVKAYFDGFLNKFEPCACAVGNLVAANNNYSIDKNPLFPTRQSRYVWNNDLIEEQWSEVHLSGDMADFIKSYKNYKIGKIQLESTGYTINQTCKIEYAFMYPFGDKNPLNVKSTNFNGLMAVIDCLMEIHQANDQEIKEAKELFIIV